MERSCDLVVLANPDSPTGQHLPRQCLESLLWKVPARTRIWVDETYIDYVGSEESLEAFAVESENVIACKALSEVLAWSGARTASLGASPHQLEALRALTPPWALSLSAQVAVVRALENPDYYQARYEETAGLASWWRDEGNRGSSSEIHANMGAASKERMILIAVKEAATNQRMIEILESL